MAEVFQSRNWVVSHMRSHVRAHHLSSHHKEEINFHMDAGNIFWRTLHTASLLCDTVFSSIPLHVPYRTGIQPDRIRYRVIYTFCLSLSG